MRKSIAEKQYSTMTEKNSMYCTRSRYISHWPKGWEKYMLDLEIGMKLWSLWWNNFISSWVLSLRGEEGGIKAVIQFHGLFWFFERVILSMYFADEGLRPSLEREEMTDVAFWRSWNISIAKMPSKEKVKWLSKSYLRTRYRRQKDTEPNNIIHTVRYSTYPSHSEKICGLQSRKG